MRSFLEHCDYGTPVDASETQKQAEHHCLSLPLRGASLEGARAGREEEARATYIGRCLRSSREGVKGSLLAASCVKTGPFAQPYKVDVNSSTSKHFGVASRRV